jgi:very-short-patch-repair endonuclease
MLKDIAPGPRNGTIAKARNLRRKMSLPEVLVWRELRTQPDGLKFRRQHASGRYVLDFYCSDARLSIEVDGKSHAHGSRPVSDATRDAWFREGGIETLRISAVDVLNDCSGVASAIVALAKSRLPLHHPAAPGGPPPRGKLGEE